MRPAASYPNTGSARFRLDLQPLPAVRRAPTLAQMGLLVWLATFLLYAALTPWFFEHYQPTGDEPHYLVITHSLLRDGDIDLRNNYQQRDYQRFIAADWLDPHVAIQDSGAWHPVHEIALSLLILPAYALGGYVGVCYFLNAIAALVAANAWLLASEVTESRTSPWAGWAAVSLTLPLLAYAYAVYTEIVAALLIVWVVRQLLSKRSIPLWSWAGIGLALVGQSWLVVRFLPIALAMGGLLIVRALRRRVFNWRGWLCALVAGGLALIAISLLNAALYGHSAAIGLASAGRGSATLARLFDLSNHLNSLLGWLWDQRQGLFAVAPIYACLPLGLLWLWQRDRWQAMVIGGLLGFQLLLLGFTHFQVRWGIPPRYLVGVLPMAAAPLALAWDRFSPHGGRVFMAILGAWSLLSAGLVIAEPTRAFHTNYDTSQVWSLYESKFRIPFTAWLPRFMPSVSYKDKGWDDRQAQREEPTPYLLPQYQPILSPNGKLIADERAMGGLATAPRNPQADGVLLDGPHLSLPAGAYQLVYRLRAPQIDQATALVAALTVRDGQGMLARRLLSSDDLSTTYGAYSLGWSLPERTEVKATLETIGGNAILADMVTLAPSGQGLPILLALSWSSFMMGCSLWAYWRYGRDDVDSEPAFHYEPLDAREQALYWLSALLLMLASMGLVAWQYRALAAPKTYQAEALLSQTGAVAQDAAAGGSMIFEGRVGRDDTGWLVYGPYESFAEGSYVLRVRLRAGASVADGPLATIEMTNVAADPILARQELFCADLSPDRYKEIPLAFENPDWQKLVFRLYFHGRADIAVDEITIEQVKDR